MCTHLFIALNIMFDVNQLSPKKKQPLPCTLSACPVPICPTTKTHEYIIYGSIGGGSSNSARKKQEPKEQNSRHIQLK